MSELLTYLFSGDSRKTLDEPSKVQPSRLRELGAEPPVYQRYSCKLSVVLQILSGKGPITPLMYFNIDLDLQVTPFRFFANSPFSISSLMIDFSSLKSISLFFPSPKTQKTTNFCYINGHSEAKSV